MLHGDNAQTMFRTSLSTAAALASAFGIIGTSIAATIGASIFVDVSGSHANAEAIAYVRDFGVVSGYPDGTFKPARTINRAEFTKIIVEARHDAAEIDDLLSRVRLAAMADVESDAWYAYYVNAARALGMVGGYPDGTFKPAATINVAESAKILAEAYDLQVIDGDVWYEGYVRALADLRAIPASIERVNDLLTRGEMAEMVFRLETGTTTKTSVTYDQLTGGASRDDRTVGPGCKLAGCGNQLCVNADEDDIFTTCEWREEYACYEDARCEKQADGDCGWTETPELASCLADKGVPTNSCAVVLCPTNTRCEDGRCIPPEGDGA